MSVLHYRLVGRWFQLDDVSACCKVNVETKCRECDVSGLMVYLEGPFELLSLPLLKE